MGASGTSKVAAKNKERAKKARKKNQNVADIEASTQTPRRREKLREGLDQLAKRRKRQRG